MAKHCQNVCYLSNQLLAVKPLLVLKTTVICQNGSQLPRCLLVVKRLLAVKQQLAIKQLLAVKMVVSCQATVIFQNRFQYPKQILAAKPL